jgi:two-component system OmpR family sensor kinase
VNRLWVRLTLAFVVVALIAVATVALLVHLSVDVEFRRYLGYTGALAQSDLVTTLANYYREQGDWAGVEALLDASPRAGRGWGRGPMGPGGPALLLADAEGRIIYDRHGQRSGESLTSSQREEAIPIQVDGRTVGYLLTQAMAARAPLDPPEQDFLNRLTSSLILASLFASLLGLMLGIVLARGLTAPLRRLVEGARALARRDLSQRVHIGGTEEVAEVGRAFNEMAAALEAAERQRQNLMADVAHELRTPLTVLQGNLRALLDGVYPLRKEEVAALYDETRLLSRLVGDLRDLAQMEAGQLTLKREQVDLEVLLRTQASHFQVAAEAKGVRLTVEIPETLPPALADPDRTAQVVRNLLSNALRHTPADGQITVRLTLEAGPPSMLRIEVVDSGEGIAPEDLPHVFDRFWRANRVHSRETGGSGLGLAIARSLVEAQGGRIGVESRRGEGSRFWFTLPVYASLPQ